MSQFLPRATLTPPTRADGPTADHLVRRETGKECRECSLAEWVQLPPLPGPATGDRQRGGSPPPPTYLPPSGGDPTHNGPTFGESDGVRPCHHNSSCPQSSPERFIPQKRLAEEVTRLVHGGILPIHSREVYCVLVSEEGLTQAKIATQALFGEHQSLRSLSGDQILHLFSHIPCTELNSDLFNEALTVGEVAVQASIVPSQCM